MCVCALVGEGGHHEIQYGEADREQGVEEDISGRMVVKEKGRKEKVRVIFHPWMYIKFS